MASGGDGAANDGRLEGLRDRRDSRRDGGRVGNTRGRATLAA